jgi:hypothetical protein
VSTLKKKLELRYGKTITFAAECNELAAHIHQIIGVQISAQTLRRVLGFIQDGSKPSKRILKAIEEYCGLTHAVSFDEDIPSDFSAAELDHLALLKNFYNINLSLGYDFNYHKACGNVAKSIVGNPRYLINLSKFLTSNEVSQIYFFERFPYIDGICTDYKIHFMRYVKAKQTTEAQLFGNNILFLGAFLSNNVQEMDLYLAKINALPISSNFHPFPQARKVMSNLLYHFWTNNKAQLAYWTTQAFVEEKKQLRGNTPSAHFPFFQFTLADAFNIVGDFAAAKQMIDIAELEYKRYDNGMVELGYFECFDMVKAITLYHLGNKRDSKRILERIEPANFIFIQQNYFLIQLKHLQLNMCTTDKSIKYKKLKKEQDDLISKTRFTYFENALK